LDWKKRAKRLRINFVVRVGKGENTLRITAKEDRGNEGVFEGKFLR